MEVQDIGLIFSFYAPSSILHSPFSILHSPFSILHFSFYIRIFTHYFRHCEARSRSTEVSADVHQPNPLLGLVRPPGRRARPGWGQQVADPDFDVKVARPAYTAGGPRVLLDEAHFNVHTTKGSYKAFADLVTNDGYEVVANTAHSLPNRSPARRCWSSPMRAGPRCAPRNRPSRRPNATPSATGCATAGRCC